MRALVSSASQCAYVSPPGPPRAPESDYELWPPTSYSPLARCPARGARCRQPLAVPLATTAGGALTLLLYTLIAEPRMSSGRDVTPVDVLRAEEGA